MTTRTTTTLRIAFFTTALAALGAAGAHADTTVDASVIVIVSDDILKTSAELRHGEGQADDDAPGAILAAASGSGSNASGDGGSDGDGEAAGGGSGQGGNDNNRSGLGDGTNPGQGSGTGNSPNEGTDNPNNAPH